LVCTISRQIPSLRAISACAGRITVTGLCERARVNKKTFYRYYEALDDLLAEFQEGYASAYAERIRGLDTVRDQAKLVRALFEFSAEQGAAYERITCAAGGYGSIRQQMIERVEERAGVRNEPLAGLDAQRSDVLHRFLGETPLMVYRLWVEGGKQIPLTEAADLAVALTCKGMDGYLEATGARRG
jgi:AcrR family transcriptional regulator